MDGKNILLIYPGDKVVKPRIPMSVLALATYLKSDGYSCRIIDERIDELDDESIDSASLIGISTMSGAQLKCATKTASRIKRRRPEVPLIWGGAHPSSFSEQTAQSSIVDFVVKCEGEEIFSNLVKRLLKKEDYSDIEGIAFKRDGRIISNPVRGQWLDMEKLPFPDYRLLDIKKYADYEDGLSYETSRGCPFRCTFCYVEYFHHRRWRGKSVEKVLSEMKIIKEEIGVKKLYIIDDNFFANKKRSMEICSRLIESGVYLKWSATARADFISSCSDNDMSLIQKSGCEILAIGAESGSPDILKRLKKDITPQQISAAVKKCISNNIMPTVSFIIGLPFETGADIDKTLSLYDELMSFSAKVEINGLFIYVPYAGTSIFDIAVEYGYKPKKTLEEWGGWTFSDSSNNPWLKKSLRRYIDTVSTIARFKYLYHRFEFYSDEFKRKKLGSPFIRLGYEIFVRAFSCLAEWRWRKRFFAFPYEWILWKKLTFHLFKVR